ncbi:hypothetical protein HDV06_001990 [Boothiomyces sp. JEL0866]|nr:hypothetical protein HDV06_001990 [Boothiomyces sp. JEL0866]
MKLPEIKLINLATKEVTSSTAIIKKPTLFLIVRRPGCFLCREQAAKVSFFRRDIIKFGLDLVAIFKEELGTDEFKPTYWRDSMYLDESREFYKFVNGGKISSSSVLGLVHPESLKNGMRATNDGYTGNIVGEGFVLGGVCVVDKDGNSVYEYAEKHFGDHAPIEQVLDACKQFAEDKGAGYDSAEIVKKAVDEGALKFKNACSENVCSM